MSKPEKYINLAGTIIERLDVPCGDIRRGIVEALAYQDRHPDQVPGRTITESEFQGNLGVYSEPWAREFLSGFGITVVPDPDPEPTSAERWETFCKKLGINLTPWQIDYLVEAMDKSGVKASEAGGEDE